MNGIKELIKEMSKIGEIESIALAGSRAVNLNDELSDYDVYVYCNNQVDKEIRHNILKNYCEYMEINNTYWGEGWCV